MLSLERGARSMGFYKVFRNIIIMKIFFSKEVELCLGMCSTCIRLFNIIILLTGELTRSPTLYNL